MIYKKEVPVNSEKSRQFKINKKFEPAESDAGDELFPNGYFEFNITKLLAFIESKTNMFPVEQVEVKKLVKERHGHLNEETVLTAKVTKPIVLAEISPGRYNVIDGHHRLERARREGFETIPVYRVGAELHHAFLTSANSYKAYVKYWNSKLEEA
jgi:hypothetical protein